MKGLDTLCASILLCGELAWAFQGYIPIGAIFDKDDDISEEAFKYAIQQHNQQKERDPSFEFNITIDRIDISDNFQLASAICRQMGKGVFAILGQKEMKSSDIVRSFTSTFHMPFLTPSLSRIAVGDDSRFELHMRPDYTYAITDVIDYLSWGQVHFLYDSDEGLLRLQQIFWSLRDQPYVEGFAVQRLQDVRDVHDELRLLDRTYIGGMKNFVLDLSSEEAYELVLRQIPEVGMNKYGYNYLLGSLDFKNLNLTRFRHGGVNVTGFQLLDEKNEISRDFLEALGIKQSRFSSPKDYHSVPVRAALIVDAVSLLGQAIYNMMQNDTKKFRSNFRRGDLYTYNDTKGIPCDTRPPIPWMHGTEILQRIKEMRPTGLSGSLSFDVGGFRQDYSLGVYSVSIDQGPTKIGTWFSDIRGFESEEVEAGLTPKDLLPERQENSTKIVTSILVEPFLMWVLEDQGQPKIGNDRFDGYAADLARELSMKIGIEYAIRLVKDKAYGIRNNNTSEWNGMIGELIRKEADLAIAPLTITAERERYVDFSKPFMNIGISIMIQMPEKQKPGVFSFMQPLSVQIWVCITVAYIGVSVGLFLVSRFSPLEWKKMDTSGDEMANEFSLFNSFWFSMGALMFQGSDSCPRSISGRIIGGVWWFFVLIIISSYTANLAAFLTIERMFTPIESADDLAAQTTIKYGTLDSGTTLIFFKTSEVPTYKQMWNFMSANKDVFVKTTQEGIAKVRDSKGKYAFLLESSVNDYTNNRKPCDTMKVGPNLNSKGFGIATPRGSILRDMVTLAVLTLREDGTLHTLKNKWWYEKGQCGIDGGSKDSGKRSLSLSNVAGIFYILVGGLVFAIILGVFEFMCFRAKHPKTEYSPPQATYHLRGTETATTICTPNDREDGALPYDYPHDKNLTESHYTYDTPRLIGFEAFNDNKPNTDV